MKNNSLSTIKSLINSLPEADIKRAEKFISGRDFESLQLLIKSAIKSIKKGLSTPDIKNTEKYSDFINNPDKMDNLERLHAEVVSYKEMLDRILEEEENSYESFPEYFDPDSFSEEDIL